MAPKSGAPLRQSRPPTQPGSKPGLGSKRSQGSQGLQGLPKESNNSNSTLRTSKSSSTLEKSMQKRPSSSSLLAAGAVLSRPQSAEKAKSESPKKTHRQEKQQLSQLSQLSSRTSSQSFAEQTFSKPQTQHPVEWPQHPQSPAAESTVSLKARLRELKECLDEGLLTPEEFQEDSWNPLDAVGPKSVSNSPRCFATCFFGRDCF